MPKKHKSGVVPEKCSRPSAHEILLAEAPGVEAMEKLFQRLDGILFCIKDREGCYLSANDAFLRRARGLRVGRSCGSVCSSCAAR